MLNKINYIIFLTILCGVLFINISVQAKTLDPEHKAAARKFIEIMKIDQQMKRILPQIVTMLATRDGMNSEQVNKFTKTMVEVMVKKTKSLTDKMVDLYAKAFTKQELDKLSDFYSSPVGAKVISKLPQLTTQGMQMGQQWATEIMPEILSEMKNYKEKI